MTLSERYLAHSLLARQSLPDVSEITSTTTSDSCGNGTTMQPKAGGTPGLGQASRDPALSVLASLTGAQPQGADLLRNPSAVLSLRDRLFESDARTAVILEYADSLLPTLEKLLARKTVGIGQSLVERDF